jgi:hypothetical protein
VSWFTLCCKFCRLSARAYDPGFANDLDQIAGWTGMPWRLQDFHHLRERSVQGIGRVRLGMSGTIQAMPVRASHI